jgi:hypothetical protein
LYDCSEYRWVSPSFVVLGIMVADQLEGVSFRVYDICGRNVFSPSDRMMQGHVSLEALTLDTMMGATANANICF